VLSWFCESLVLINLGRTSLGKKAFIRATGLAHGLSLQRRIHGGAIFLSPRNRLSARRLERRSLPFPDPAQYWFRVGTDLYRSQKNAEAVTAFRRSLTLNSENAKAWSYLAQVYTRLGRPDLALEAYGHALAIDPLSAPAWNNKGLIHRRLHRVEPAITAFRRALSIDRDSFNAYYNLGLVYLDQQRYIEAVETFDRALAVRPGDPRALDRKKFALQEAGPAGKAP
jgi:tetratricopeptide (TPR) repeat protein